MVFVPVWQPKLVAVFWLHVALKVVSASLLHKLEEIS